MAQTRGIAKLQHIVSPLVIEFLKGAVQHTYYNVRKLIVSGVKAKD
jgi:hypothetical protein